MLPLRLNDRDRDRTGHKNHHSSPSSSSGTRKHRKHRSSNGSSRSSTKDQDRDIPTGRSSTPSASSPSSRKYHRRFSMPVVDEDRHSAAASFLESRTSLPYPTFSKAHSKEFVGKPDPPTPDPTDLTEQQLKEERRQGEGNHNHHHHAPPSPPLTSVDQQSSRKGSTAGDREKRNDITHEKTKDGRTKIRIRTESTRSSSSLRSKEKEDEAKPARTARPETPKPKTSGSYERDTPSRTASHKPSRSHMMEEMKSPKRSSSYKTTSPPRSPATVRDAGLDSTNGSEATIAPQQRSSGSRRVKTPEKPPSRTQNRSSMSHGHHSSGYRTPVDAAYDHGRPTSGSAFGAPPPPPPPPEMPAFVPRVDYLLQHGGLNRRVPKTLLLGSHYPDVVPPPTYQPHSAAHRIFEPFNGLLDEYQHVMSKNGSLAVATGYRSVARRLLDRLEAVFARDISSESCGCLMCVNEQMAEPHPGVSWGEILELVSGRRELPTWPPFMLEPSVVETGSSVEEHIPMQKMDIDIPEQYREHYVRQSRKTKVAVDKWLNEQTGQATSAPDAVDDDTLTFAMLTHLGPDQRPLFCSLLGITSIWPTPKPDGQASRPRPHALLSSALAIQRLYRLSSPPRDPETAIYMLNNPGIHHVLATLAGISDDEWDILISGRFDGFLRSGAEESVPNAPGSNPRWGSRSNTPFSGSRGPTPSHAEGRPSSQLYSMTTPPASFGGPIALDEEMEIGALAEVEREIYLGMEALEDAFEALHFKAEIVRRTLRERGAGLSVANQNRRGSYVEARMGTPSSALNGGDSGPEDDFLDDGISLAPDDSASNVSSSRRRRPKRRTERRTPAPVEEEDEGEEEPYLSRRDRERGSRRR